MFRDIFHELEDKFFMSLKFFCRDTWLKSLLDPDPFDFSYLDCQKWGQSLLNVTVVKMCHNFPYLGQSFETELSLFSQTSIFWNGIRNVHNVFKFHAYSVNKRLFQDNKRLFWRTAKACPRFVDVATTNVCKVDTSNRNHIERSRWMKWLITGLRDTLQIPYW